MAGNNFVYAYYELDDGEKYRFRVTSDHYDFLPTKNPSPLLQGLTSLPDSVKPRRLVCMATDGSGMNLADYCLHEVAISVPPSAKVQVSFLPVYEQFRADIEHDDETDWATIGIVIAIGVVAVAAAAVTLGAADALILGAMVATETGVAAGGEIVGTIAAAGVAESAEVATAVIEPYSAVLGGEGGIWTQIPIPPATAPPPVVANYVRLTSRLVMPELAEVGSVEAELVEQQLQYVYLR